MKCYTYLIGWSSIDKYYYGVRANQNSDGYDLWVKYFTSSKVVKRFRELYGEPDIIQYRRRFVNKIEAFEWESKVLRRMKVVSNPRFLNCTDKTMKYLTQFWNNVSPEFKEHIHQLKKSPEQGRKISKAKSGKPNYKIRGSRHPGAVEVCINGQIFGTLKEAARHFGFSSPDQIKTFLGNPNKKSIIVNGKYFGSKKEAAEYFKVSRSILDSFIDGDISTLAYPTCNHCNVTCKSVYLFKRWHSDCG